MIKPKVCIVGGGFGGLYSALYLQRQLGNKVDITVVEPKDEFVFVPLLYELLLDYASPLDVTPKYSSLLKRTSIKLFQDKVLYIKPKENCCLLEHDDEKLKYDFLVIAVGIQPKKDTSIEGLAENTLPFYQLEHALALQKRLKTLHQQRAGLPKDQQATPIKVTVIGGGCSGVELACNLAENTEKWGKIETTLIHNSGTIMTSSTPYNRKTCMK